jgi:hypothetical protein
MADLFRALVQIVVGGLRVFNLVGNIDLVGFELGRHNGLLTYALFTLDPVDVRAVNRIFHWKSKADSFELHKVIHPTTPPS